MLPMGRSSDQIDAVESPREFPVDRASEHDRSRPIRRSRSGAPLGPGRGAGIAAAVLLLLVGGIALGSMEEEPRPTASPTSTATADTALATVLPCRPGVEVPVELIALDDPPRVVSGLVASRPTLPGAPDALVVRSGTRLAASARLDACVMQMTVERVPVPELNTSPFVTWIDRAQDPAVGPAPFELGALGDGDWLVRARATFVEFGPGHWTYFRVLVGSEPFSSPRPVSQVTPRNPCASDDPAAPTLAVQLSTGVTVTAVDGADPEVVHLPLGEALVIVTDADRCALSWTIEAIDDGGAAVTLDQVANPDADQAFAAQNRWQFPLPFDSTLVRMSASFAGGRTVVALWQLVVDPFVIPDAYLVAQDGTKRAMGAGCGLYVALANGYSAGDDCGSVGYPAGLSRLTVRVGEPVTFEIPGWGLLGWFANCGRIEVSDGIEQFVGGDGCQLGGGFSDAYDAGAPIEDPAVFLVPPGAWVIQVSANAIHEGDQFGDTFFLPVTAR